ncbi:MAG: hypothetical protein Tsb005_14570 [Gammaproteobacteria bacterium]
MPNNFTVKRIISPVTSGNIDTKPTGDSSVLKLAINQQLSASDKQLLAAIIEHEQQQLLNAQSSGTFVLPGTRFDITLSDGRLQQVELTQGLVLSQIQAQDNQPQFLVESMSNKTLGEGSLASVIKADYAIKIITDADTQLSSVQLNASNNVHKVITFATPQEEQLPASSRKELNDKNQNLWKTAVNNEFTHLAKFYQAQSNQIAVTAATDKYNQQGEKTNSYIVLTQPFFPGEKFTDVITNGKLIHFSEQERLALARDLFITRQTLKTNDIVHRDLTADNFIVQFDENGKYKSIKLIDFGIAVAEGSDINQDNNTDLNNFHVPPEYKNVIAVQQDPTIRTTGHVVDNYMIGVLAATAVTGNLYRHPHRDTHFPTADKIQLLRDNKTKEANQQSLNFDALFTYPDSQLTSAEQNELSDIFKKLTATGTDRDPATGKFIYQTRGDIDLQTVIQRLDELSQKANSVRPIIDVKSPEMVLSEQVDNVIQEVLKTLKELQSKDKKLFANVTDIMQVITTAKDDLRQVIADGLNQSAVEKTIDQMQAALVTDVARLMVNDSVRLSKKTRVALETLKQQIDTQFEAIKTNYAHNAAHLDDPKTTLPAFATVTTTSKEQLIKATQPAQDRQLNETVKQVTTFSQSEINQRLLLEKFDAELERMRNFEEHDPSALFELAIKYDENTTLNLPSSQKLLNKKPLRQFADHDSYYEKLDNAFAASIQTRLKQLNAKEPVLVIRVSENNTEQHARILAQILDAEGKLFLAGHDAKKILQAGTVYQVDLNGKSTTVVLADTIVLRPSHRKENEFRAQTESEQELGSGAFGKTIKAGFSLKVEYEGEYPTTIVAKKSNKIQKHIEFKAPDGITKTNNPDEQIKNWQQSVELENQYARVYNKQFKPEAEFIGDTATAGPGSASGIIEEITKDGVKREIIVTQDFVEGETLNAFIKEGKLAALGDAGRLTLARNLLQALADLAKLGISHRDIWPQNVMVDKDLNVRLIDFGNAIKTGSKTDHITNFNVTYSPPEIFDQKTLTDPSLLTHKTFDNFNVGGLLALILSPLNRSERIAVESPFADRIRVLNDSRAKSKQAQETAEAAKQVTEPVEQQVLEKKAQALRTEFNDLQRKAVTETPLNFNYMFKYDSQINPEDQAVILNTVKQMTHHDPQHRNINLEQTLKTFDTLRQKYTASAKPGVVPPTSPEQTFAKSISETFTALDMTLNELMKQSPEIAIEAQKIRNFLHAQEKRLIKDVMHGHAIKDMQELIQNTQTIVNQKIDNLIAANQSPVRNAVNNVIKFVTYPLKALFNVDLSLRSEKQRAEINVKLANLKTTTQSSLNQGLGTYKEQVGHLEKLHQQKANSFPKELYSATKTEPSAVTVAEKSVVKRAPPREKKPKRKVKKMGEKPNKNLQETTNNNKGITEEVGTEQSAESYAAQRSKAESLSEYNGSNYRSDLAIPNIAGQDTSSSSPDELYGLAGDGKVPYRHLIEGKPLKVVNSGNPTIEIAGSSSYENMLYGLTDNNAEPRSAANKQLDFNSDFENTKNILTTSSENDGPGSFIQQDSPRVIENLQFDKSDVLISNQADPKSSNSSTVDKGEEVSFKPSPTVGPGNSA